MYCILSSLSMAMLYIPLYHNRIHHLHILPTDPQIPAQQPLDALIDVRVDLRVLVLLLQSQQVEDVIPLALLLDHVDVIVDKLEEFLLEDLAVLPFVVYYRPDVLLLYLRVGVFLKAVVELLDLGELDVRAFLELADLASALLIELYVQGLLPLAGLDIRYEVYRQRHAFLDSGHGADYKTTVDMHAGAVGHTLVLEVEHLLPDTVTVFGLGLIEGFLLEDAALHLVEELLLGQGAGEVAVVLVILLSLLEGRMALAWKEVDLLLEELVVEVVVLDLLQEADEGLLESTAGLTDVDQWLVDQHHLVLGDCLATVVPQFILRPHLFNLLREVLTLRRGLILHHRVPIEYPALIGDILRVLEVEAVEVRLVDETVDLGQQRDDLGVSLQFEEAVYLAVVAFVVGWVEQDCEVGVDGAGVVQPQLEEAGRAVGVQDRAVFGTRPEDVRQCFFVLQNGLNVFPCLEVVIGLFPQLLTAGCFLPIALTIDDGDVISQKDQLRQYLALTLPPERIRDADLHPRHEAFLHDAHLFPLMIVDCHQDCQRVLLVRPASCGEHISAVFQPNHPQDSKPEVDKRVDAGFELGQAADLSLVVLVGHDGEPMMVEVQFLPLEGLALEHLHSFEVIIAEGTKRILLEHS